MPAGRPSSASTGRRPRSSTGGPARPVLSARAGIALGVVVVLIAILAIPFKEWVTQRSRIADLEAQLAWHTQRVEDLTAAHKRWDDPAYVEAQARARLHFVRPGEVGYVVLTEETTESPETTQTRPMAQAPEGAAWWAGVWSTIEGQAEPSASSTTPAAPAPATPADSYSQ